MPYVTESAWAECLDRSVRDDARVAALEADNARLRGALEAMVALYDTDEGCRSLPAVVAARAALDARHD